MVHVQFNNLADSDAAHMRVSRTMWGTILEILMVVVTLIMWMCVFVAYRKLKGMPPVAGDLQAAVSRNEAIFDLFVTAGAGTLTTFITDLAAYNPLRFVKISGFNRTTPIHSQVVLASYGCQVVALECSLLLLGVVLMVSQLPPYVVVGRWVVGISAVAIVITSHVLSILMRRRNEKTNGAIPADGSRHRR